MTRAPQKKTIALFCAWGYARSRASARSHASGQVGKAASELSIPYGEITHVFEADVLFSGCLPDQIPDDFASLRQGC
jgi:hypothetical protein